MNVVRVVRYLIKSNEEASVRGRTLLLVFSLGLIALSGCAGKGEVIPLHVQASDSAGPAMGKEGGGLSVAVMTFEDSRPEKNRLGTRTHFWGGESYFNVPGGKPGEIVAQAVADYLKRKGWRAEVVKPGGSGAESGADVMLSGKLLDLSVDAKGKFGSTEITTKTKVVVEALNRADSSTVRMTLNGAGSQSVFWFEPEDAQGLMNEVLSASLEKLVVNTQVKDGLLRLTCSPQGSKRLRSEPFDPRGC